MLFSSFEFVMGFLPITLAVYYLAGRFGGARAALVWLTAASLFFYGWWNPEYLLLLGASIAFNYLAGLGLGRPGPSRLLLAVGIAANLALLGYFKYAGFLTDSISSVSGGFPRLEGIVLPLAISFFTFQQIAFLVEAHKGQVQERNPLRYCLFVSFFPQLIAGPIVHHGETLPQFMSDRLAGVTMRNLAIGGTIFILGLGKKLILADSLADLADPVFGAAAGGGPVTFIDAWGGTLAYTFQIYFDFSAYSDMAIGLAAMFGIQLPINFNSPYRAGSVIEFWQRWHITLSRFLRLYLYIPLGGNRKGDTRLYANLLITMLLGGLWHGAGWTFVAWGGLHGIFLVINHIWIRFRTRHPAAWTMNPFVGHAITLMFVVLAWVFFRAESFDAAFRMYEAMLGFSGMILPEWLPFHWKGDGMYFAPIYYSNRVVHFSVNYAAPLIGVAALIAIVLPNVQEIMGSSSPAIEKLPPYGGRLAKPLLWRPNVGWAIATTVIVLAAFYILFNRAEVHEFIYFQF